MTYKALLLMILSAGAAHASQLNPIKDDLTIEDIAAIVDDLEYQASDQAKVALHANNFLRQVYKDASHD